MKKSLAFIMALAVMVTSTFIGGTVMAEEAGNIAVSGNGTSYNAYEEATANFSDAQTEIKINGASFVSASGKIEKAESFEGKSGVAKFITEESSATYEFVVPADAKYTVKIVYRALKGRNNPISMGLTVDGAIPFDGISEFELPRLWQDSSEIRVDGIGNEFSPSQEEVYKYNEFYVQDPVGVEDLPYEFALKAGKHTIKITSVAEPVAIAEIIIGKPVSYKSYEEVSAEYNESSATEAIKLEGEDANLKSTFSLVSKSDSSNAKMSSKNGQNAYLTRINYIGNTNWQMPNERITWNVTVPSDGLYKIGFRFLQNYVLNGNSYRRLLVDGKVPFAEANNISFNYDVKWGYKEWTNSEGTPYLIYLSKGEHEISFEVSLGEMNDIIRRLQEILYEVGITYRKIVMITGESPDSNRDYDLFGQIPNLLEDLTRYSQELETIASDIEALAGLDGGSNASSIRGLSNAINKMLEFPLAAHTYVSLYHTNYSSVSALVFEMMKMPLALDFFTLVPQNTEFTFKEAGFFEGMSFTLNRFFSSFSANYNNISGDTGAKETIDVWVNWGRDQVRILNDLIQSSFTPQTGIGVNLKISNASYIQGIVSGNGPDCSLHMARSEPVNLAMRGSMYNLKNFPDYEQVLDRFSLADATVPYTFQDGVYAIPDTLSYYMLFYRTDIFEEYGLKVPTTWDEFIEVSSLLMRNNLQASLPYIQLTAIAQVNMGVGAFSIFPSMLIQKGGKVYNDNLTATDLTSSTALEVFKFWTDFYNEYKFPVTADFFNRFRLGTMPMGIQSYTTYVSLSMAAPEISGKWAMAPIPGFKNEDGTINNYQAGSGTGCGILNIAKNKKGGWEFLKWWTSTETQLDYSNNCESILGVSGRVTTSNAEAFRQMGWDSKSLKALMTQWSRIKEIPEVPGGYYTARVIDQAYWNVVNNGKNSKDMLVKWAEIANNEIKRKRKQYNVQ